MKDRCPGCHGCTELCDVAMDRVIQRLMDEHREALDALADLERREDEHKSKDTGIADTTDD